MLKLIFVMLTVAFIFATPVSADDVEPVALKDHPDLTEFSPTGKVKKCISSSSISATTMLDDWTMLFRLSVNKYYVNRLSKKCRGLEFYNSYMHQSFGGAMCKREFIYVNESGSVSPVPCSLGEFIEYRKDKKDEKEE